MGIVYKAKCLHTAKVYIGITVEKLNKRINKHFYSASKGSTTYFHNAIRKYGRSGFEWTCIAEIDDVDLLKLYEVEAISKYKWMGVDLYNTTRGGDGAFGLKHSEECKQRMSAAAKGRVVSQETKDKMSASRKGKPKSLEWREKIRASQIGRPINKERIRKMVETKKGTKLSEEHKKNIGLGLKAAYDSGKRDRLKQRRPRNGVK